MQPQRLTMHELAFPNQPAPGCINRGKYRSLKKALLLCLLVAAVFTFPTRAWAQCASGDCDAHKNYGFNSNGDAATIEYDNFVSGYHSTIVRTSTGFKVWGQNMAATGAGNLQAATDLSSAGGFSYTGTPLLATLGSNSNNNAQGLLLTTDGLYAWGKTGVVLSSSVKSSTDFGKVTLALPVAANAVKMLFATYQTLAIVSCTGNVYVLTQSAGMRGDGGTNTNSWVQVQKSTGGNLTNVVAVRGCSGALIALTATGELYTWGAKTYLGNTTAESTSNTKATLMTAPKTGTIKMIGANNAANAPNSNNTAGGTSYYVLYADGALYALGRNNMRQLGNWPSGTDPSAASTYPAYAASTGWVQPKYSSSGSAMNDIQWISSNEHDGAGNAVVNVINNAGRLWNWGTNAGIMLGRTPNETSSTTVGIWPLNPGQPAANGATGNDKFDPATSTILAVATGGHTSMMIQQCQTKLGYVGHATAGSAGDNSDTNYGTYKFTVTIDVCGAAATPSINVIITTPPPYNSSSYCVGSTIKLQAAPAGGSFTIKSGAGLVTFNSITNELTFNSAGSVTIEYGGGSLCGTDTKTFTVGTCQSITGKLWLDHNGDAIKGTSESITDGSVTGSSLYINLVDPSGKVVGSVKVQPDGTYTIPLIQNDLVTGNYKLILTNSLKNKGDNLSNADALQNGYGFTGTNVDNAAFRANRNGIVTLANLKTNFVSTVDFGISNDPIALPVSFGPVTATFSNGLLTVNWTTNTENDNSYFEIEASKDGQNFTSIGSTVTKAENGHSSGPLNYVFSAETGNAAGMLGLSVLSIALIALCFTRKNRWLFLAAGFGAITMFGISCTKNEIQQIDPGADVYIRIKQVDKEGLYYYSKIVKVSVR